MAVLHDITRSKEAERRLVRALGELESSNKELEQFASVASHDLQEPLRKIAGFTELLERRYRDRLDGDADRYLTYIVDAAKRMRILIDELLSYSRLGRGERKYLPIDCNKVLEQVLGDMEKTMKESGALVTHDELPAITADGVQLGQVFQNLIANAVKFCGNGQPRIHVSARHEGDEWIFSVRDNGIGIEPQFFPRIFGMFQRLHTQTEYPGSGIGLAVCKKIIERHGGRIWVESTVGKGSTFCFALPARGGGREDA
jgi:light-regulated signal transduction histidine kinase (bacteriophytochrome)